MTLDINALPWVKPAAPKQMIGRVTGHDGRYFIIESPDAPAHLRVLNLVASQMCGAVVGDRVRLEYQMTSRSGLWNVVAVVAGGGR